MEQGTERHGAPMRTAGFYVPLVVLTALLIGYVASITVEGQSMYYWEAKRRMKYIQLAEKIHYERTEEYTADTRVLGRIIDSFLVRKAPGDLYHYTANLDFPLTVDSVWHNPCTMRDIIIAVDPTGQFYQIKDPDWEKYGYIGSWDDPRLYDKARWEADL